MTPAVSMTGMGKRFGAVSALEGVDLTVQTGEIHAIVGENGAGKTTLMNLLYGRYRADAGTIRLFGDEVRWRNSAEAIRAGIGMVSQHYSILPELSALENLLLGAEPGAVLSRSKAKSRAEQLAVRMGFSIEWDAAARELSPAGAQKLEILKLLWRDCRILILDEPTAMLSPADGDALFGSLKSLTIEGATVLLVTHRLPEVIDHANSVTVLRGGRRIASGPVDQTDASQLAAAIVGHQVSPAIRSAPTPGERVLRVEDLVVRDRRGFEILQGVSLEVRSGEIVGLAGVDGNGQRELFQVLMGTRRPQRGRIEYQAQPLTPLTVRERLDAGMQWIPEDRLSEGAIEAWSLVDNAALGLQWRPPMAQGGWLTTQRRQLAEQIAERFQTRHGGVDRPLASLSGGNQQRFVNARALYGPPSLLLAFQPTRGLDIDATRRFYEDLAAECQKGSAALVVSFDLDELIEYTDRILVLNGTKLRTPPPAAPKDRAEIGKLMVST